MGKKMGLEISDLQQRFCRHGLLIRIWVIRNPPVSAGGFPGFRLLPEQV
jgi:hypothetical protein